MEAMTGSMPIIAMRIPNTIPPAMPPETPARTRRPTPVPDAGRERADAEAMTATFHGRGFADVFKVWPVRIAVQ
ncbi:hypothetical protein BJQ90_03997 [Arthrobacter sp. SO3]|nr:hypothetical protein [Arthrobacter sp. SO3]